MRPFFSFINPLSFYLLLLLQNYLVKTSQSFFFCTVGVIPPLIYLLLVKSAFNRKSVTFKILFFSLILPLLDFISLYFLFNCMLNYSSYIVISLTGLLFIFILTGTLAFDIAINLLSSLVVLFTFVKVLEYEVFGNMDDYTLYSTITSQTSENYWAAFIICIFRIGLQRNAFYNENSQIVNQMSIFFFMIYTAFYLFIDMKSTIREGYFGNQFNYLTFISIFLSILWLFSLDKLSGKMCHKYIITCIGILCIYFIFPNLELFGVSRIESSLYFIYLTLFIILISLYCFLQINKYYNIEILRQRRENNNETSEGRIFTNDVFLAF